MPAGVYTYTQLSSHLSAILGRHPNATYLRLQLLPPVTGPHSRRACGNDQGSSGVVVAPPLMTDSDADLITLYAVLLRRGDNGSGDETVAVYTVVGHVSHISFHWCAQLQRSLSVTALLLAPTRSLVWHADGFHKRDVGTILSREGMAGVSSFEVQLSPYVPLLKWCRAVDGVFGSHHSVCSTYTCLIGEPRNDDDDAGAAHPSELWEERDGLRRPSKAAVDAATTTAAQRTSSVSPPMRMPRWEGTPAATETSFRTSTLRNRDVPLRVAAVLNGNVPLDDASSSTPGTRVLCLVALDGSLLTGSAPPDSPSLSWPKDLFHTVGDFVSREVMPRVSLRLIDGRWARAEASEHLLDDVCKVRQVLGRSYVVQYSSDSAAAGSARARSIVIVLDLSVPLQKLLVTIPSMRSSSLLFTAEGKAERWRRRLAAQFAEAVQDTIGQLVSLHPDMFAFTREDAATVEGAPTVQLSRGPTHFTREMHCRSIAASVAQISSLSPHPAFVEEVVRLLWGCEADTDGTEATAATTRSGESLRVLQRQPDQIQRRIEERLLSVIRP